jgi:hypothetical protein
MATKPADFFIGVADFFGIILPGALLSYLALALDDTTLQVAVRIKPALRSDTAQGWVAFALSSYLLGHFASLIGACLLDPVYKWTYVELQKRRGDQLYKLAGKLKDKTLDNVTLYKWARMSIRLRQASAMQEIDRLEADSKFFRSVTVVLLIFCGVAGEMMSYNGTLRGVSSLEKSWVSLWAILVLLSFWRFSNLRWKAEQAAYLAVLALEDLSVEKAAGAA